MKIFIFSARWSINIALAAVFGFCAMQLILLIGTAPLEVDNQHTRARQLVAQVSTPALNISPIVQAYLFGKPKPIGTPIAYHLPPETQLNLKLHGIYYSSDPMMSYAMIAAANGKSSSYRVGESLLSGAVLHKIEPRQVILFRNGRYETLYIMGGDRAVKDDIPTIAHNDIRAEKLLGNYQRQLRTNPKGLMNLMRFYAVKRGGRFVGYRIKPGKDARLLSRFSLRSGDILTAVNGVNLDSPLKGLGLVQQLATANQVDLEVLRNGQVVSLSFFVEL
ncbi:MAG: type II secretion system protein GspC [Pseudomonadota bacterium]